MSKLISKSISKPVSVEPVDTLPAVTWSHIWQWTVVHKPQLINAHIIALLSMLLTAPIPLMVPVLIDEVILAQGGWMLPILNVALPEDWQLAWVYVLLVTGLAVFMRTSGVVLGVLQMKQFTLISKSVTYRIRVRLLDHLQRLSLKEYTRLGSGEISAKVVNDVNTMDDFLANTVGKVLLSVFSLVGVAAILLWLHWQLALFILLFNPIVIYFTFKWGGRVRQLKTKENQSVETFQQALNETLDGLHQIRAAGRDKDFFDRVREYADHIRLDSFRFSWKTEAANRMGFLIFMIGFELFRGLGVLFVLFSDLTIGQMIAIFGYLWFMMGPVNELLSVQFSYNAADGALGRLNGLLDTEQDQRQGQVNAFEQQQSVSCQVRDVHFTYQSNAPVLRGVNFDIKPGEKVAIVGASGGGKTTLIQAMLGFYALESGRVTFNDTPLSELDPAALRQNVALVLQHPAMFNATIRHNLDLGQGLADEMLWQALQVAQLNDFVASLPQQLDEVIGREGLKMSGGQRQRLAIARMVLQDPKMVILDEATSALDMQTERRLHQALDDFLLNRTTVIVAHRLTAIRQADRIVVLKDGQVSEQGTHHELMQQQGLYADLYQHYILDSA